MIWKKETAAGMVLCELREDKGVTQKILGEKLGVTEPAISLWESGKIDIPGGRMLEIRDALGLDADEYRVLVQARFPSMDHTYSHNGVSWLENQPEKKRAGVLLRDCRERFGLTQKELIDLMEQPCDLSSMENGTMKIRGRDGDRVEKLIAVFRAENDKLPEADRWFEARRFREICELSDNTKSRVKEMRGMTVKQGAALPVSRMPDAPCTPAGKGPHRAG